jgi:Ni,Fe-hydrogenase III large subunit
LAAIGTDIAEIVALALGNPVVLDRFTRTAILTHQQAVDLGTLGYVTRASGLTTDVRHDHPHLPPPLPRTQHTHTGGDVLAGFEARAEEIANSITLITRYLDDLDNPD